MIVFKARVLRAESLEALKTVPARRLSLTVRKNSGKVVVGDL